MIKQSVNILGSLDKESILKQVARISESHEFSKKPLMVKFLRYLVEKFLEGRGDQLKGYTIAIELFEQGDHFDSDQNALVRINAGRLRRSLKIYYLDEGQNDPIIIDIPKGQYCPIITHREQKSKKTETRLGDHNEKANNTIAVLPLENHTGDSELDYLTIGFSHELSDALTKYDELKVIGADRKMNGSLSESDQMEQLRSKNVSFLITGDLMSFGNLLKINFRLIYVDDNSQIWTGNYKFDREKENLFDVQEKITSSITSHLGGEFGHINKYRYEKLLANKPKSLNEQELLLKFYHVQSILSAESLIELHKQANEALEKDPDSVVANALLAGINMGIFTQDIPGSEEAYALGDEYAERAYALNSSHKIAITNLAGKCFYYHEKDRISRLYEQSRKWMPMTPFGLGLFGMWFSLYGDWERGKKLTDQVFENNIYVPTWYHGLNSLYHYRNNDYEQSLLEAAKYQLPGFYLGPVHRIAPLGQLGRLSEGKMEFERLLKIRPDFETRGRYLLKLNIKDDTLVEHLLEGFEKIGVNVV